MSAWNVLGATIDQRFEKTPIWKAGADAPAFCCLKFRRSEGIDDIQYLGAVPGLLDITELAPAAIGDAGLGYFFVGNCVVGSDVLAADDSGHAEFSDLVIDPDLLGGPYHEVTVGQDLGHDGRHLQLNLFVTVDLAGPFVLGFASEIDGVGSVEVLGHQAVDYPFDPEDGGNAVVFGGRASPIGTVVEYGLIVDIDDHRQDIADLGGSLVTEESTGARAP